MTSFRSAWTSTPLPSVVIPNAAGDEITKALRDRFERAGYPRYALLDRGSYDVLDAPEGAEIVAMLTGIAAEVTGRELAVAESRVVRLRAGDYLLAHHDRIRDGRPVELVLDLSATAVPGAEIHYRHRGQVFFTSPCVPGTLTLVERGPTITSNHTYVSKRLGYVAVVRLIVLLAD